ncbi:hypothetical protein [Fulvivirga sp.]|uniref:hypothetical protein n=1 Tax=Fulvivirga sp. TaxID=1931237 RepID=UPI0032EC2336
MILLLTLLLCISQDSVTPEQRAIDIFKSDIYLSELAENPCQDDDPDCIYLGDPLIDYYNDNTFLSGYKIYINPELTHLPHNAVFPDSLIYHIDGPKLYERKVRIYDMLHQQHKEPLTPKKNISIHEPFLSSKSDSFDPNNNKHLYVEVSQALDTGQEYFVAIEIYQGYKGQFNYQNSFGYDLIFDKELNLLDITTGY